MKDFEQVFEFLGSNAIYGYGWFSLPHKIDDYVRFFVQELSSADGIERWSDLGETRAMVLIGYAERMASLAVRDNSVWPLTSAATALCIGGAVTDVRDAMRVLALVADSASKLGVDTADLFRRAVPKGRQDFLSVAEGYARLPAYSRDISLMGYREGMEREGFRYQRIEK